MAVEQSELKTHFVRLILDSCLITAQTVPSASTALFYFMTEKLKFEPELFGRFAAFQALASLVGIFCYSTMFKSVGIRQLYVVTTLIVGILSSLSIALVKRWNLLVGIPDTAFVVTDGSLIQFVGEINSLPIFVMATRMCPQGLESSMYAFLWTAHFVGADISTYISCFFDGLPMFIVVCSLWHLLPICLVYLLPNNLEELEENKEDDLGEVTALVSNINEPISPTAAAQLIPGKQ